MQACGLAHVGRELMQACGLTILARPVFFAGLLAGPTGLTLIATPINKCDT